MQDSGNSDGLTYRPSPLCSTAGGMKETWTNSSQPGLAAASKQMGTGLVALGMGKPF